MFCPYCGTKCENTHRFCYACGSELPTLPESAPQPISAAPAVIAEPVPVAAPEETTPVEESVPVEADEPSAPAVAIMPEATAAVESIQHQPPVRNPMPYAQNFYGAPAYSQYFQPKAPAPAPVPAPAPAAVTVRKDRIWPPLLIIGIMMILGTLLFFLRPSDVIDQPSQTAPANTTACFSVSNGILSFDASLYNGNGELEIPESIDGQLVTVIGADCFRDCTELTAVILPDTLTEIDDRAFYGCTSLRGIFIPEGVTRIGSSAFANCSSLEAIHLPESIETIADRALFRCPKLIHIFYAGKYKNWEGLYNGSMPNNAWVYCEDGNYPYTRE